VKIVYHGGGYTGFTGAVFAARAGHDVVIYEPNERRVADINAGREPVVGIDEWLGSEIRHLPSLYSRLRATSSFEEVRRERVHLFAVPTERDGEPMFEVLNEAIDRVLSSEHIPDPLVISVESTVHPDFAKQLRSRASDERAWFGQAKKPFTLIVAPRRDWFVGRGHTVETCERVIGVDSPEDRQIAEQIYGPISKSIHWTDTETAEIVKQLENAEMYAGVTFLMGFALAYKEKNVREIVRLAGTHWRLPAWYLTLGVAGYCVPLGMKYLTGVDSATVFEYGQKAIQTERQYRLALVDRILSDMRRLRRIAILGISDKPNQRIQHLSPALTLYHTLLDAGLAVQVHDAQFTPDEVGVEACDWLSEPHKLEADAVIVHTAYPEYRSWLPEVQTAKLVIDGPGIFEPDRLLFQRLGVEYFRVGDPGWLGGR
jgi:nucleotide sugar dehydrogenase